MNKEALLWTRMLYNTAKNVSNYIRPGLDVTKTYDLYKKYTKLLEEAAAAKGTAQHTTSLRQAVPAGKAFWGQLGRNVLAYGPAIYLGAKVVDKIRNRKNNNVPSPTYYR